jgi:hypothetical protein
MTDQLDLFGEGIMKKANENAIPYPPTFKQQLDWVNRKLDHNLTDDRKCMIHHCITECKSCCKECIEEIKSRCTKNPLLSCPEYDPDVYYQFKREGKL